MNINRSDILRREENAKKGYIFVKQTSQGYEIYKKRNEAGGWTYWGESCAIFGVLWDDCCGDIEEFIAVVEDCYNLKVERKPVFYSTDYYIAQLEAWKDWYSGKIDYDHFAKREWMFFVANGMVPPISLLLPYQPFEKFWEKRKGDYLDNKSEG